MSGRRRQARECALMVLYAMDLAAMGPDLALERFFASFASGESLDPPPPYTSGGEHGYTISRDDAEMRPYAETLIRGVHQNKEKIDALITETSLHWRLDRMALVDRNLLRLGVFELTEEMADVPRKVALNEAIEVAKTFGTAESSAFINGILDRIGK